MKEPSHSHSSNATPTIACQRCRLRKTRCDRNLPKCRPCERANAPCLTTEPTSGRSIPRSYLSHLEARVRELESELSTHQAPGVDLNPSLDATPDQDFLGASSGLTFTRILNAALKEQLGSGSVPRHSLRTTPGKRKRINFDSSLVLPPKNVAENYLEIYFQLCNSQMPILHREEFIEAHFEPIYGYLSPSVKLASLHTPMDLRQASGAPPVGSFYQRCADSGKFVSASRPEKTSLYFLYQIFAIAVAATQQHHEKELAENLHLTAMEFYGDMQHHTSDPLKILQGVLLLALYSVMRPATPGIWYVIGTAMRMCEELGLHNEDRYGNTGSESASDLILRDKKRRLFWCSYSLDRQICIYLGRPLGIADHVVRTPFPSMLDDSMIRENRIKLVNSLDDVVEGPTYKRLAMAFFEMRQIQGQIQNIVYDNAEIPRAFSSFQKWREYTVQMLDDWFARIPRDDTTTNIQFRSTYMVLNYLQARLLLYGISPANPRPSESDMMVIAHAGLEIIRVYAEISAAKDLNYSWSAVHNLFMAGTSYLYVLYHHSSFRNKTSITELETVVISALDVMDELAKYCEAAVTCHSSFKLLSQAVIELLQREKLTPHTDSDSDLDVSIQNFLLQAADNPGALSMSRPSSRLPTSAIISPPMDDNVTYSDQDLISDIANQDFFDDNSQTGMEYLNFDQPVTVKEEVYEEPHDNVYEYLNEMSQSLIWNQFLSNGGRNEASSSDASPTNMH